VNTVDEKREARNGLVGRLIGKSGEFRNPERRLAYYMVLPTLLIVLAVAIYPVADSIWLSLHQATLTLTGPFVGLKNYVLLFQDTVFQQALGNTVVFTAASVTIEFFLGFAVALALNRRFRGRGLVRAAVLIPWVLPTVISAVMWRLMLQDQIGILSYAAYALGLVHHPILLDRTYLMIAAILVDAWQTTPFIALLLLAGLQTIPREVYEAARVDGASALQRFFRITVPLLKPTILVAVLFRTLDAYRVYDLFYGLANRQLESLSTYVYEGVRITQLQFATGNAAAVFIFVSALLVALFFIKVLGMRTSTEE
jgi:trehalose/maltose transport system permease protein